MYIPKPIDTNNVVLPEQLMSLQEKIAENVHEIWAQGRIADGWTYGEKRDDELKHHPCLVPYSELSDAEKEYDRNTAMETLKLITALGYKIEDPSYSKEMENDELTDLGEISLSPDVGKLKEECDKIMASDEKFVYDEIDSNKSKDAR